MENIASNLFYSPLSYCFCRELNDGLASDGIDGDVPELLKAILSRDPTLFQSKKPAGWYNTTGVALPARQRRVKTNPGELKLYVISPAWRVKFIV